ncbi:DUF7683 domain-containing protein [Streptomyces mirabilis]|jgi:hypothetical protein|uniref:DUF7683 domain-containing protein n=1 Tax=Streptomyces mirabilis TaxID=68239 RepID=A0A1I2F1P0_9ACTN|nr:hypothetical protein [Streptomyces mirabilis]SFE98913.1 hypothetical protein SAMN02787118_103215 [Streptomyces mirabilis]
MRFVVARYEKDADSPDSVTDLSTVDVNAVSAMLGVPAAELTDVHPLEKPHRSELQRLAGVGLDLERYEYFLEVLAD